MPKLKSFFFLGLLFLGIQAVWAEGRNVDQFSRGWGVAGGAASGLGLSYRQMNSQWGHQITGIVFLSPEARPSDPVFYSLGAGLLRPLGVFEITNEITSLVYLQGSVASHGGLHRDGSESDFGFASGLGFGVEWLFFDHFSLNLELTETLVASGLFNGRPAVDTVILPQAALYFRF